MVFDVAHSRLARTIGAAEERVLSFDAMPDNPASAVIASRSEFVDRTLEAVERMARTSSNYLEGQVIIVAADFTLRHLNSPCFSQQLLWQAGYFSRRSSKSPSGMFRAALLFPKARAVPSSGSAAFRTRS